jgi:putative addiction module component (TIGR02574 family)
VALLWHRLQILLHLREFLLPSRRLSTRPALRVDALNRRVERELRRLIQTVLADALRLDPDARAELVAEILASLDGPADEDAESAWDAEIERRIHAIEAGEIPLEPWDSVKRRIEKDLPAAHLDR